MGRRMERAQENEKENVMREKDRWIFRDGRNRSIP